MTDFKKLKVVELRAECSARSLPQTGKRDELIERLEEYEFHNAEPSEQEESTNASDSTAVDASVTQVNTPVISITQPQPQSSINSSESHQEDSNTAESRPVISPIQAPTPIDILAAREEEKRRLRALRFGLDPSETAPVKIEVTIKRLEHALPNRHRHNRNRNHKRHHRQISINKA